MGKTNRYQKDDGEIINFRSKRKGKQSRKERKSKASLQNLASLQSERHKPRIDFDSLELARDADGNVKTFDSVEELIKDLHEPDNEVELEGHEPMDYLGFDTVEEMLEELHEPDDTEKQ